MTRITLIFADKKGLFIIAKKLVKIDPRAKNGTRIKGAYNIRETDLTSPLLFLNRNPELFFRIGLFTFVFFAHYGKMWSII